jgi:DNA-binding beta-propeller fold protein YncE
MLVVLVGLGAVLAWLGWLSVAPALGFPDVPPAAVLNAVLVHEPDTHSWVGWLVLVAGLCVAAGTYVAGARRRLLRPGLLSGNLYGLALWAIVGAALMPLLGVISGSSNPAMMGAEPAMPAMRPRFMMLGRGALAPLDSLIAWLVFGGILGGLVGALEGGSTRVRLPFRPGWVRTVLIATLALVLVFDGAALAHRWQSFEVWTIDQVGGGALYIYDGRSLLRDGARSVPQVIDLSGAAAGIGDGPGLRPHMIRFNRSQTYAFIANVKSGHVYVMRARDRRIVASIDVGEEVHDVAPSPDGRFALASKQNDKKIGVIATDYSAERFTYDPADDLDLGALEGPDFPDNQPVCAHFVSGGRVAYVTLRGGGMYVVDVGRRPMRIIGSFPKKLVAASGCGAVVRGDHVYLGWGTKKLSALYVLDQRTHRLVRSLPVMQYGIDGHALARVGGGRYAWMAMRGAHTLLIIDTKTDQVVGTIGGFGLSPDTPVVSPTGEFVFVTLRGLEGLSGARSFAENAAPQGPTPGIVVFKVLGGGRSGMRVAFVPLPSRGGKEADPHAIRIRMG